jgi:hypothetical protein
MDAGIIATNTTFFSLINKKINIHPRVWWLWVADLPA